MEQVLRIYLDFLSNFFGILFLVSFASNILNRHLQIGWFFLLFVFELLYSLPESIPLGFLLSILLDFILVFFLASRNLKQTLRVFVRYECIALLIFPLVYALHSLVLRDFSIIVASPYYQRYKNLICISVLYIFYILYINTKKSKSLHTRYPAFLNTIMILMVLFLSCISLFIIKKDTSSSGVLPVFFSFIYILILIFTFIYGKLIDILKENALSRIQLQKNELTAGYAAQLEENLKTLRSIRHDMKNHLLVIDGYASQEACSKIQDYIGRILGHFSQTYLIQTPSVTLSTLLNAKYQESRRSQIDCGFTWDFEEIFIPDFQLITILGNLLDNAVWAAAKMEAGVIRLSVCQVDSYLELNIFNNHREQIQEKDGIFNTTKSSENSFHGYGIQNVHSAVASLNGQISISHTDSEFTVTILLPNY